MDKQKLRQIGYVIINWLALLTSPIWILPCLLYTIIREQEFFKYLVRGDAPFFL